MTVEPEQLCCLYPAAQRALSMASGRLKAQPPAARVPLTPVPCSGGRSQLFACSLALFPWDIACPLQIPLPRSTGSGVLAMGFKALVAHSQLAAGSACVHSSLRPRWALTNAGSVLGSCWSWSQAQEGAGSPKPTCSHTGTPLCAGRFVMAVGRCGHVTDLAAACVQLRSSA